MTPDVLVIGGGIAGTSAALAANAAGARTVLVRAGPGATALAAGGWHGEPPHGLRAALVRAGLELTGCRGPLPHADGRVLHADYAPLSHASAALTPDAAERVTLVCGIDGLPAFRSRALAALWCDAVAWPATAVVAADLILPGTPADGWATASLAAHIERHTDDVGARLVAAAREHAAHHVIVPAVLGLHEHERTFAALAARLANHDATLGEALTAAPSAPGRRLDRALLTVLELAGVRVITGRVAQHDVADRRVRSIIITRNDESITITPRVAVLASGKFIGGGIASEPRLVESVLGTAVSINRFGRMFANADAALALTDPVRSEPQPLLGAGVAADADSRMVSAAGDVVFDNVLVTGSIRSGVETASLGLGTAACDGWDVGTRAAGLSTAGGPWD